MRLGLHQRWLTENQRFFLSSQQRARVAGRSLLPSEPGEAAWVRSNGWRLAHRSTSALTLDSSISLSLRITLPIYAVLWLDNKLYIC